MTEWLATDDANFQFCSKYGNDFLNHVARVLTERDDSTYTPALINAAIEWFVNVEEEGDAALWEQVSRPSVDALEGLVEEYLQAHPQAPVYASQQQNIQTALISARHQLAQQIQSLRKPCDCGLVSMYGDNLPWGVSHATKCSRNEEPKVAEIVQVILNSPINTDWSISG